ncbi:MAG: hypothetical protein P9X24_00595 [Candidatus Hatepunaea meridiana]|nr:hypothetical protein [Candidatus Hatepunaea meridiana]
MTQRVKDIMRIVKKLEEPEKNDLIRQLLGDDSLFEDLEDAMIIASQQGEPTIDYDTLIQELRKEGRPV